jgi:hypothetical protein
MMTSNNALVPDPDKQDDLASKFWQWPLLHVGLRMCGWNDDSKFSLLYYNVRALTKLQSSSTSSLVTHSSTGAALPVLASSASLLPGTWSAGSAATTT